MLVELRYVEVEIEIEEVLSKALTDMDLSVRDAIDICENVSSAEEILDFIDDEDIQKYCSDKGIELECNFEMMAKNLKDLSNEERASLLWFLIGVKDDEIKKVVTVEIVIPRLNKLIQVRRSDERD